MIPFENNIKFGNPGASHEQVVVAAIHELTRWKTLITIAHRLSTVRSAHQIVVVNKGKIAQKCAHGELVLQNGIYRRFLQLRSEAIGWKL